MTTTGDPSYLSTVRAAQALGVSVSTVKRWVDDGILPAHRSAGGHRKLLRSEVLALARQGNLPQGDLTELSVELTEDPHRNSTALSRSLLTAVLQGDGRAAWALLRRAYNSGISLETLADQVIAPAMWRVGCDWATGRIDIWEEHRGTQVCATALYALKDMLQKRAERNRPVAVGGAPSGDASLLPTLLAQMVLLDAGWDAVNLGPNTPLASLTRAMRTLRPRLVWLSVSYITDIAEFLSSYKEFHDAAVRLNVAVAVGGQALTEPVRSKMLYTAYGDGMRHLAAFARTLHPRPKRPTRGRPTR